ncbi:hypothetical protein ACRAKI_22630 [Saccharothrix isguenensis]
MALSASVGNSGDRSYSSVTVKALFALGRNYCYAPNCSVRAVKMAGNVPIVQVEIAHITAAKKSGPRWDERKTPLQRKAFSNLLLLCVFHHKLVDRKPTGEKFSTEELVKWKSDHEGELSKDLAALTEDELESAIARAVTGVIDATKMELLEAIDRVESLGRQTVDMLKVLVSQTFDQPQLDLNSIASLAESADLLRHLPDSAHLLRDSSRGLQHLQDSVPMLHRSSERLSNLPDYIYMLYKAADRLALLPDYIDSLHRATQPLNYLPDHVPLLDQSATKIANSHESFEQLLSVWRRFDKSTIPDSGRLSQIRTTVDSLSNASNGLAANIAAMNEASELALNATRVRPPDRLTYVLWGMVIGAALVIAVVIMIWPGSGPPS